MSLRLFVEEDVSPSVAAELRKRQVDALSVHGVNRTGLSDEDQLAFAPSQGHVPVTQNRADFQALGSAWRAQGRSHAGIVWGNERTVPRRDVGNLIRALGNSALRNDDLTEVFVATVLPIWSTPSPGDRREQVRERYAPTFRRGRTRWPNCVRKLARIQAARPRGCFAWVAAASLVAALRSASSRSALDWTSLSHWAT